MNKQGPASLGRMLLYCSGGGMSVFLVILLFADRSPEPIPPWKEAIATNRVIPLRSSIERRERITPYTASRKELLLDAGLTPSIEAVPEFAVPAPPDLPAAPVEKAKGSRPQASAGETTLAHDAATKVSSESTAEIVKAPAVSSTEIDDKADVKPDPAPEIPSPKPVLPTTSLKEAIQPPKPVTQTNEQEAPSLPTPPPLPSVGREENRDSAPPPPAAAVPAPKDVPIQQMIQGELPVAESTVTPTSSPPEPIPPVRSAAPAESVVSTESTAPLEPVATLAAPSDAESLGDLIRRCRASYEAIEGGYTANLVQEELGPDKTFGKRTLRLQAHIVSGRILIEWMDTVKAGRKISIESSEENAMLRVHLGPREPRLFGTRMTIDQNHILVRSSSRYPINKLGIHNWIRMLEKIHAANENKDDSLGKLTLADEKMVDPSGRTLYKIEQSADTRTGESFLPPGGHREWYIDADEMLPVQIIIVGADGQPIERHQLTNLQFVADLTEDALILE